jgi:phenylacetate-coenzyme A ligase PaaK-like adenylate-forming protein
MRPVGTTGKPTVVGYTQRDIDTWATVVARSIRAGGAKPGDMVHVSYGYGLFTGGLGAHYGAEKSGPDGGAFWWWTNRTPSAIDSEISNPTSSW